MMKQKAIDNEELEKIKEKNLLIITGLKKEYDSVVKFSRKKNHKNKKSKLSKIINKKQYPFLWEATKSEKGHELVDLILERKDRRYAALTIELASTMEYFLREIYYMREEIDFNVSEEGSSSIKLLERELKSTISIKNSGKLYLLNHVRNQIIHGEFSLKKAKNLETVKSMSKKIYGDKKVKSKEYLSDFINTAEMYIKNVEMKVISKN